MGFCWIVAFMDAVYQFTIAYVVGEYYYTPPMGMEGERHVPCCSSLCGGLELACFKHAGSLALGSFLVAVLMFVQKIIEYAEKTNKEGTNNPCITCILCCLGCCVKCCKDTVEAINKQAYIDIAITIPSPSFCRAGQNVLKMIVELGGAMAILNGATFVFTIFGGLVITVICGGVSYMLVHNLDYFAGLHSDHHVDSGTVVVIVSCCIAAIVASAFMNVFDMTSDTLLYCYGHDLAMRNGGPTAPPALKELFHMENSKPIGADTH